MKHLFIGLDVHKKTWSVTIQQEQVILKRFSMEAHADTLIHYIQKHYPECSIECCYESCCLGYHIYRELQKLAGPSSWSIPAISPASINKVVVKLIK